MRNTKALAGAFAVILCAQSALADGFAEPLVEDAVMAPDEIAAATAGSSAGGILVPLILLALIAVAGSGGGTTMVPKGPA